MDELQLTFINERLFLWGISSESSETFTPILRLEKISQELFSTSELKQKKNSIEIAATEDSIIVPSSLKWYYNQFNLKKVSSKTFLVEGLEIGDELILTSFLSSEKKPGILLGDSYELFRTLLKFSFSLVSRERFVPYYQNKQSKFISNLDYEDDYSTFNQLLEKSPFCIKAKVSDLIEDTLKQCLDYFSNLILTETLQNVELKIVDATKTDKWLFGLLGDKVNIDEEIQKGLKEWLSTQKVNENLDYKILFKLELPDDESNWKMSFNLQSKKDPSLILNIAEIWNNPKKVPIENFKIYLLKNLGIAAKYSKIIETALYKPNNYELFLSSEQALSFMSNDSFILSDAGFRVQIPKIMAAKSVGFKVKVKLKENNKFMIKGTGTLGSTLFDFDYSIAIGDLELSAKEFYELSKRKETLVKIKGKWVELNQKDIQKVLDYFQKNKQISLKDTFLINSSNEFGFEIDEISTFNDSEHLEAQIKSLFNFQGIKEVDIPKDFSGNLREYQKQGVAWMALLRELGFGGILADDMGLGKTIQAIAYILYSAEKPSLIICPTSVLGNWQKEFKKFSPSLKVEIHHGLKRLNKAQFLAEIKDKDVIISSYAIIRRDEDIFANIQWENIFLDEAQNIKNSYTQQAKCVHQLKAKNRFCLTGTPIENRLSELWSIMNFVNPGFLSNWNAFKKNFAEPIELQNNSEKVTLLKRIIFPFLLRREKTDKKVISELPEKIEAKEYCSLTEEQASLYQAIVDDSLQKISEDNKNRRALIMAALIKLKQVCNHPANYLKDSNQLLDRSNKVNRLREMIEMILSNKEKCLIFTQYKEMGDLLYADLRHHFDVPICFLHGQLERKKREEMIEQFQSEEQNSPQLFILSLKAGGIGINLTRANHVIHFDRWWNPAVENQATDRAFRIGQSKNVFVYKFITSGTIEEKIDEMIERKQNLAQSLLDQGSTALTELNDKELKELFSLRKESLEE